MPLKKYRKRIDKIDENLLKLFNQRAKEVTQISKLKSENKLGTYAAEREVKLLNRLDKLNAGPLKKDDIEIIFNEILSVCRSIRTTLRIVYLGPKGTFTHLASIKKFGKKSEYVPAESINEVFEMVEGKEFDYGVVPIENSTEGVVNYTLDTFFTSNLKICAEMTLNVSHFLLGKSKSLKDIKRIYSHPQVFAQCRKWLSHNLTHAELIPTASTAKAALYAGKDPRNACMGNKILSNLYDLNILASSVEDSKDNHTRFLVIAKEDSKPSGKDKTSILFSIKDKVGALHDILNSCKKNGVNLTKIESRPSKKKAWEYYFFVDLVGHRELLKVQKVLSDLEKRCVFVKVLGSYPMGK